MARPIRIYDIASPDLGAFGADRIRAIRQSPATRVFPRDTPILEVAQKLGAAMPEMILVEDPSGGVCGFVDPAAAMKDICARLNLMPTTFRAAIEAMVKDPNEEPRERPGPPRVRPGLFWCEKGKHYTSQLPCPTHG